MHDRLHPAERAAVADFFDTRPPAMVIADDIAQDGDATHAAEAAGWRVNAHATLEEGVMRVRDRPDGGLVIVELGVDENYNERALLGQLSVQARDASMPIVISFPLSAIDRVVAHVEAEHATLLCDPTRNDRVAAFGLAAAFAPPQFMNERENVMEVVRLQALADEVARIARALTALSEEGGGVPAAVSDGLIGYRAAPVVSLPMGEPETVRAEDVRTMIRLRRQRDSLFGTDLFADPAWDMMLDLLAARIERLRVAVSSLCIASAVPPTTALRWIKTLTDIGVLRRVADPTDGRRVFIELSESAARSVLNVVGQAKRAGTALV